MLTSLLEFWGYCTAQSLNRGSFIALRDCSSKSSTARDADHVKLWIIVNHLTSSSCRIFLHILGFKSYSHALLCFSSADVEFYNTFLYLPHASMEERVEYLPCSLPVCLEFNVL